MPTQFKMCLLKYYDQQYQKPQTDPTGVIQCVDHSQLLRDHLKP